MKRGQGPGSVIGSSYVVVEVRWIVGHGSERANERVR